MEEKALKMRMEALSTESINSALPATVTLAEPNREPSDGMARTGAEIVQLESARSSHPSRTGHRAPKKNPVEEHIGKQLKTIYNDVLAQPVPDRFLELMNQLDARPSAPASSGSDHSGSDHSEGE